MFSSQLAPNEKRKITGRMLKDAFRAGRAGEKKKPTGRRSQIPAALLDSVATFAQMQQINGEEQAPRRLAQTARAAVQGSALEGRLSTSGQMAYFLKKVRESPQLSIANV